MPGKNSKKAKSKAQAAYFGAVIGGAVKAKGLSKSEAKDKLRGVKISKLPSKVKKR